ncbi:Phytoene/squalene synthetase [Saccharicrinis carchari]|uniref:Phytoene/squalene synthetase n=1 Tax=Saccharicrinis carchari TaxID=1168039 RepID=A0A521B2J0_SACCC|nr:phytoene/squalene synthase family protein [Saccharicrinis carchari]SMO41313.1 Phytoene/squalene synthetase [Saccharicrinis carchari]
MNTSTKKTTGIKKPSITSGGSVHAPPLQITHKVEQVKDKQAKIQFDKVSYSCSRLVTQSYSTSFSIGVRCLNPSIRQAIYSIYGFVRFADEIVDTFHAYNKPKLLDDFERDYYSAVEQGISLNPILNSFQHTVQKYSISDQLVQAFLRSMRADLYKNRYNASELKQYIYGSADVVGLMCLKVFVNGDEMLYQSLKDSAERLGSAFQKVNFLRDIKDDKEGLGRVYFPQLSTERLNEENKEVILQDIYGDYHAALKGIKKLPGNARLGVYIAYTYYLGLTHKIAKTKPRELLKKRVRISNPYKLLLLAKAFILFKLGYL